MEVALWCYKWMEHQYGANNCKSLIFTLREPVFSSPRLRQVISWLLSGFNFLKILQTEAFHLSHIQQDILRELLVQYDYEYESYS